MKNFLKKEKGITLVALVITVIIMLILAGVAISALTTDGGLFSKTQSAVEKYNNAVKEQDEKLADLTNKMNNYYNQYSNSEDIPSVIKLPISEAVSIGDYVNYDAGKWTEEDFTKIINSSDSNGNKIEGITVNKTSSLPTSQGQFGGFILEQSRNSNSKEYSSYIPNSSGWMVWDKDETTGVVTLISAGHPESYYSAYGKATESVNILKNRDCSMYENSYAKAGSAHILTGQEVASWYKKQGFGDYTIEENGGSSSTLFQRTFVTQEPISTLENGSVYWLATAYNANSLYDVEAGGRVVSYNGSKGYGFGIRILVTLNSNVFVEEGAGDGSSEEASWKLVK